MFAPPSDAIPYILSLAVLVRVVTYAALSMQQEISASTPGRLVVVMNIACFLLLPMLGNLALGHSPLSIYHYSAPQAPTIFVFLGLFALCFTPLFGVLPWNSKRGWGGQFCVATYTFLRRHILWLSIILLIIIVLTFSPDWADYRYRNTGISTLGTNLFIVLGLKAVIAALLLWLLAEYFRQGEEIGLRERLSVLVLSTSIFYTASGSADIFMVSIYFVLFLTPKWFVHFTTIQPSQNLLTPRTYYKNLALIVVLMLLMMSFRIGEPVKHGEGSAGEVVYLAALEGAARLGFETPPGMWPGKRAAPVTTADMHQPPEVESGGAWGLIERRVVHLLERLSTHYYSALQFFDGYAAKQLKQFGPPISYPLDSLGYRLRVLFKSPHTERPDITSLSPELSGTFRNRARPRRHFTRCISIFRVLYTSPDCGGPCRILFHVHCGSYQRDVLFQKREVFGNRRSNSPVAGSGPVSVAGRLHNSGRQWVCVFRQLSCTRLHHSAGDRRHDGYTDL